MLERRHLLAFSVTTKDRGAGAGTPGFVLTYFCPGNNTPYKIKVIHGGKRERRDLKRGESERKEELNMG